MRPLREIIPIAVILVFIGCFLAIVLEMLIAGARGQAVPSNTTAALSGVLVACMPILGVFYRAEIKQSPRPPEPPAPNGGLERTGDGESDRWNEDRGWLEMAWPGMWRLS